ncbi:right-handed parallel beta-helix repeat-containing protein [Chitinophaga sp. OAE865]|uniref:right-handed parallel beta-helix repeat-containing protein n=1 Tax=Chitinophaga sp. OAE865 TaxID=2817898 RepID=UPI001AEAA7C0
MYRLFINLCFLCLIQTGSAGQTIFVDPAKGKDQATGTIQDPLASIDKAVTMANGFSGKEPVTIKLAPGLYLLTKQVLISPFNIKNDTVAYTIEAAILPDDSGWLPSSMPVIQSVSPNNKNYGHFDHCIGIQVERNNTCFKGLKFLGNTHPAVVYYYAIERHRPELKDMKISQCYFIGSKNAAPMQGAVFAQGSGIKIDHCIFYECRNALLLFLSVNGFSLTHSIIYGAYEGAVWFGKYSDFVFRDNIIANNHCFWVGMKDYQPHYVFTNSLVTGNAIDMGLNNNGTIEKDSLDMPVTSSVQRSGKVLLNEIDKDTIPVNYLHPLPVSAGRDIPAGIFKKQHSSR